MIVLDGASLTVEQVQAVARTREPVVLAPAARAANAAARDALAGRIAAGQPVYGGTTGVGALRDHVVPEDQRERFQLHLLRSHAVAAGRPLAPEVVRAGMVVRANQLGAGGAGVAPELLDALVDALNHDRVPVVGELGSLGTGDLPALAEIALALLAHDPSIHLGLRDALGFMSSNAITAGHAALLAVDLAGLLNAWLTVAALSFAAVHGDPVVLDPRVADATGSPGQAAVAARLRELLGNPPPDTRLRELPGDPPPPRRPGATGERPVQDAYPFRVLPQVDGVTHEALSRLRQVLARALNGRPENPLVAGDDVLPTGNFYAGELAAALDAVRGAVASSASLIAARVSALQDPRITGLTPFLSAQPGPQSGVMMLEYTAHAAAAQIRTLALPMATQTAWASLGVESHASLAATAARHAHEQLDALRVVVATELVVAARALQMAGRPPPAGAAANLYHAVASVLPVGVEDRRFGDDVRIAGDVLGVALDPS